jgi:hypothetical protein
LVFHLPVLVPHSGKKWKTVAQTNLPPPPAIATNAIGFPTALADRMKKTNHAAATFTTIPSRCMTTPSRPI